jgi:NAD(P)H-quinone oxidoreductase subunit 5
MLLSVSTAFFLFGIFNPVISLLLNTFNFRWELSKALSILGLASSLLGLVAYITQTGTPNSNLLFQFNHLTISILILIQVISYAVLRYSKTNFENDQDNQRFLFWLTLTVLAVMVTVSSNNLITFWLGWVGISLSMHQLLTFYPERYRAVLAAHKKFIFARSAEILLAISFLIISYHHKTFNISEILSHYPSSSFDWSMNLATVLVAVVAMIKCAQLPVHGWLIQVVESPTPVSAILHAGIINLGGFLLLSFATLLSQSELARYLVLLISGVTAVLAALIMMTRISIKVRLAWSTLAQMGLMLVECALGLYSLAFLHLLAHSFYKAHAFLSSGSAVEVYKEERFEISRTHSFLGWLISGVTAALIILFMIWLFDVKPPFSPWLIIGFALTLTLVNQTKSVNKVATLFYGVFLVSSYFLLKSTAEHWLGIAHSSYLWPADAWIGVLLIGLFVTYLFIILQPGKAITRTIFTWLNAGFYLDEWSTKITLNVWPIQLPNGKTRNLKEAK